MARTRSGKTTTSNTTNTTSTNTITTTSATSSSATSSPPPPPPPPSTISTTTASGISTSTSTSTSASAPATRRRKPRDDPPQGKAAGTAGERGKGKEKGGRETAAAAADAAVACGMSSSSLPARNGGQWVVYAVASGACAAFNGVFAKLTTNDLTTHISRGISGFLGLVDFERVLEVAVRCIFFGLNLVFNGVMWTLFTKALARGHSTTQVSIMNTSTNFVVTALLGLAVFAESLPPLWWAGAAMLVAGNVIIGRKDDGSSATAIDGGGNGDEGDGDDDDVESGRATPVQGDAEEEGGRGMDYGAVTRSRRTGALPVEKDSDDEEEEEGRRQDEDEDVPLLGDLEDSDRR
ncbi:hypothetical protein F4809DRAFT_601287 [Biscogniauxia mediterranea]|nr:hypothetical protein F4809DRAFT_601287 [Biscogniauxia mediterranea]